MRTTGKTPTPYQPFLERNCQVWGIRRRVAGFLIRDFFSALRSRGRSTSGQGSSTEQEKP